jgi:HK97 family phage portal protein
MDLLSRGVRALTRGITGPFGDSSIPTNSAILGVTAAGGVVTEGGALAIAAVMNCVKVLHNDMTILPFHAYTGDRVGVRRLTPKQPQIVTRPFGPDLSVGAGMGQIVASLTLRGNAYLWVTETDSDGFPTGVWVVHPDRVQVRVNSQNEKVFQVGQKTYTTEQVKHITGVMLPGSVVGMDPISYQRVTLGLASDLNQYGANFFRNGATPSGVITAPGAGTKEKARELKENWETGNAGVANAHRPAVLFGGATWAQLSVAPENAQFLQTRQFSREDICGWFGVPLQRIQAIVGNASQGGGKGLDSIDQGYATHTLLPLNVAIESAWNDMIPGDDSTWSMFDLNGLLRASATERAQIAQSHRLTGVRNRNEIREDEGWAPIAGPDGSDYNIPFNTNKSLPGILEPGEEYPPPKASPDNPTDGATQ